MNALMSIYSLELIELHKRQVCAQLKIMYIIIPTSIIWAMVVLEFLLLNIVLCSLMWLNKLLVP